jgi:hypothetical protein
MLFHNPMASLSDRGEGFELRLPITKPHDCSVHLSVDQLHPLLLEINHAG